MKLISMTNFVLKCYNNFKSPILFKDTVYNYAEFLKTPLKQNMFVGEKKQQEVIFKGFWLEESGHRPYFTNGRVSVYLHPDFGINHKCVEDLVELDLEINKKF